MFFALHFLQTFYYMSLQPDGFREVVDAQIIIDEVLPTPNHCDFRAEVFGRLTFFYRVAFLEIRHCQMCLPGFVEFDALLIINVCFGTLARKQKQSFEIFFCVEIVCVFLAVNLFATFNDKSLILDGVGILLFVSVIAYHVSPTADERIGFLALRKSAQRQKEK